MEKQSPRPQRIMRVIQAALAVGVVLAGVLVLRRNLPGYHERTDLKVFLAAAEELLHGGKSLYTTAPVGWYFTSPPMAAVAFVPLALVPKIIAAIVFFALNVALLGCTFRLMS